MNIVTTLKLIWLLLIICSRRHDDDGKGVLRSMTVVFGLSDAIFHRVGLVPIPIPNRHLLIAFAAVERVEAPIANAALFITVEVRTLNLFRFPEIHDDQCSSCKTRRGRHTLALKHCRYEQAEYILAHDDQCSEPFVVMVTRLFNSLFSQYYRCC